MRKFIAIASLAVAATLSLSACTKQDATSENSTETTTITDETANGKVSTDGNLLEANGFDSQTTPIGNGEDDVPDNDTSNGL